MEIPTVDSAAGLQGLCCCLTLFVGGPLLIMLSRVGQKKSGRPGRPVRDAPDGDDSTPSRRSRD